MYVLLLGFKRLNKNIKILLYPIILDFISLYIAINYLSYKFKNVISFNFSYA